jgi:O-antigen ligase
MRETFFYTRLIYSLIFAGVPMTIYCLIQMSGRDPVSWSSFETFGTLGNINFLSAFLGMVSISILPLVFRKDTKKIMKTFLVVMLLIDLFIIQSTGSIQGLFVFFAGSTAIVFLRLKSRELFNVKQSIFSLLVVLVSVAVIFGLANKGPLAPYLFQNSIVLRADYWHAGLEMTQNKPFFGVGMDSYGDWYREARGELSTLRGSPDRTANTAHNIFLDLSSNGGLPLLISYLAMIALAIRSSYRSYKKFESGADHIFMAIFACWIGYQVQALVSINQLGVGIWGWLLTGALIGYGELARPNVLSSGKVLNRKVLKTKMLPAFSAVMAVIGASLGFFLAWFPLRADSSYFYAAKSRDWNEMVKAADLPGSTAWHLALTTDSAYKDQAFDRALQQGEKLVRRYPRDFGGWNYLLYLPNTSPSVKSQAFSRLHQMDPFNPQYMGTP